MSSLPAAEILIMIKAPIFQNSRKYAVYPNGTMEIYDVTQDDVAFYTCRVANSFGEMSDSASLNTTGKPA